MYILISILILVACVLLGLVVLVQNPKGGGLNQSMGGVSNQVFGAKNSTGLVEKVTWGLAVVILVLSLGSAIFIENSGDADAATTGSEIERIQKEGVESDVVAPATTINLEDFSAPEGTESN